MRTLGDMFNKGVAWTFRTVADAVDPDVSNHPKPNQDPENPDNVRVVGVMRFNPQHTIQEVNGQWRTLHDLMTSGDEF